MGLINQAGQTTPQPASSVPAQAEAQDPQLEKIIQGMDAKIPPQLKRGYQEIVTAGMAVLFSPTTHSLMVNALQQGKQDLPTAIVKGTVRLIRLLQKESKGRMVWQASFGAGVTLMCMIADFAEKSMGFKATPPLIETMRAQLVAQLCQAFGITKDKLTQAIQMNSQAKQGQPAGTPPPAPASAPASPPPAGG